MRNRYERASMAAVAFDVKDIITTSGEGNGVIVLPEDPILPPQEILG